MANALNYTHDENVQDANAAARMFAALSATNEAVLRATSEEDLYQRVCDAASGASDAVSAAMAGSPCQPKVPPSCGPAASSMVRAAAKNYQDVAAVVSPGQSWA